MENARVPVPASVDEQDARRFNRTLVEVTRRLWQEEPELDAALSIIVETSARALGAGRVNVWRFDADGMRCLHAVESEAGKLRHNPPGYDEVLWIDQTAYADALPEARVIHADDVTTEPVTADSPGPLAGYFRRHGIQSVLDAPVRVSDGMFGVLCHEQVGAQREWTREEIAFAGNMGDFVALAVEIDRRRRAEARLDYLAYHDPVTGRANRRHFLAILRRELQRTQRQPRLSALLFVDIDRFDTVNTRTGEAQGDALLGAIAARIDALLPDTALVARVESDCFGVLLPGLVRERDAAHWAERILEAINEIHQAPGVTVEVAEMSASIGIAFMDAQRMQDADGWLADADAASSQAKERGRGRYEIFDPEHHEGLLSRLMLEARLKEALRKREFEVHFQPEIDLASGRVAAAEALLRWRDGAGSLRAAGEFIEVAESSGLIVPIGDWVLREACKVAAGWPDGEGGVAPLLRVNLSARQFERAGMVERVSEALADAGLPPSRLCLEITETTLMSRAEQALETLNRLRALGVSLAIDDFGIGYSSLTYLRRFPVDTLKIDRSFVEGLPGNAFDLAIVRAVNGLSRSLGLEIVAEGVEREEQAASLRELGVSRAQGWLYDRPLDAATFAGRLAR